VFFTEQPGFAALVQQRACLSSKPVQVWKQ
jgi:hypothetical protein